MHKQIKKQIIQDSFISFAVLFFAIVLFENFEVFEKVIFILKNQENKQLDEVFLVILLSPVVLLWFSIRRFRDALSQVQKRILAEQEFQNKLKFDALTGLPNGAFFESLLDGKVESLNESSVTLVLVLVNITEYENLYNCYSSEEVDNSLIKLSDRISDISGLNWIIAKPSRNTFALLIELPDGQSVDVLARNLSEQLKFSKLNAREPNIYCKLGLTSLSHSEKAISSVNMSMQAHEALYKSKHDDDATYTIYQKAEEERKRSEFKMREELSLAIENNELTLYFQPQVALNSGEVLSAEALVRWNHPEKGFLTPDKFIHLIDNHPISSRFGEWVIQTALRKIEKHNNISISVNITACHIERAKFVESLKKLLDQYPMVCPSKLKIELTESASITDYKQVELSMRECSALGIQFSLDDFGTGHSALNQLRILPISQIKIDRSFIQNFLTDRTDYMMVSSIIGLAENFNLEVVAEGIETMEQFTTLSELGCQKVQGYLFSKPLETSAFDGWVKNYNELNLLPEQRLQTKKDRMKSKGRA